MSTETLTVNGGKAGEKKTILLPSRPKKRLFIGMLLLVTLLAAVLLFGIWYIGVPGLERIQPLLPWAIGALLTGAVLLSFFGIFNMVLAVAGLPYLPWMKRQTYELINLLFHRMHIRVPADRLLVVTPHCLQLASCPHKVTRDPNNCKRCGGCNIGDLVTLSEEMGFHFFVATGGTLARQVVYNTRPKAVLAIACERDLMSGIQDVFPLPAVGVLNIRPNGPCYNTSVDMAEVRRQLEEIIKESLIK